MSVQNNTSTTKIVEIVIGVILFAVSAAMRLAPAGIRDDSGFSYIMMAMLLVIGSLLLYNGIFARR